MTIRYFLVIVFVDHFAQDLERADDLELVVSLDQVIGLKQVHILDSNVLASGQEALCIPLSARGKGGDKTQREVRTIACSRSTGTGWSHVPP